MCLTKNKHFLCHKCNINVKQKGCLRYKHYESTFLKILKTEIPNDSAISLFKEFVSYIRDNCASGFIVVLLTRAVNGTSLKKSIKRQMDNENMAHKHNKISFC